MTHFHVCNTLSNRSIHLFLAINYVRVLLKLTVPIKRTRIRNEKGRL